MQTRDYANGTSITQSFPWGLYHSARVMCPDGKVRKTKRIAQTADTFFSVPCAVEFKGKTVAGFMMTETVSGLSTATESDPAIVRFVPYSYGRNGNAFAQEEKK